jgi:glucose/arabinose dehydrogenase
MLALVLAVLAMLALLLLPLIWFAPLYSFNFLTQDVGIVATFVAVYFIGWILLAWHDSRSGSSFTLNCVVALALFSTWFALLVIARAWFPDLIPADYSLPALVTAVCTGIVLMILVRQPMPLAVGVGGVVLILAATVYVHAGYRSGRLPAAPQPSIATRQVDSLLYRLKVTTYSHWIPDQRSGGGVAKWGTQLLFATGGGDLFLVDGLQDQGKPIVRKLAYAVPENVADFKRGSAEVLKDSFGKIADANRFRVGDLQTLENGGQVTIFASHHFWDNEHRCFILRVSSLSGDKAEIEAGTSKSSWRTVFDTSPCLSLNTVGPRGLPFEGWENGARIQIVNDHELLLSVGDHGFDGVNRLPALSQDPTNTYGKVMRISLTDGTAHMVSLGHRNPQGLYVAPDGNIWETEHGPRGGDELNHIVPDANYGWPNVSLGTDYGERVWPLDVKPGRHEGFMPPVYAFVPSVGISNLIGAPTQIFPAWQGDLLVGSLVRQTLFRVRPIGTGSVQYAEPIAIGDRVRALTSASDGAVVIWADDGNIIVVRSIDETAAQAVLASCTACHSVIGTDPSFTGPNLFGVVNRRIASKTDFGYSAAMKSVHGRWTPERLDRFLANPQAVVPGTAMQFPGVPNAEDRKVIIDFLANPPKDDHAGP